MTKLTFHAVSPGEQDRARSIHDAINENQDIKLPSWLHGDKLRLKQILINLTKNALKFTLNGTIKILAAFDATTDLLKVSVIDSGAGIKASEMASLFQMFGKLNRTAEQNSEGLGMGLLICQNLVRCNHGTI